MKKFLSRFIIIVSIVVLSLVECVKIEDKEPQKYDTVWEMLYKVNSVEYYYKFNGKEDSYYAIYSTINMYILIVYLDKQSTTAIHNFKSKDRIEVVYFNKICKLQCD